MQLLKRYIFYNVFMTDGILTHLDTMIFACSLPFTILGMVLRRKRKSKAWSIDGILSDLLKGVTIVSIAFMLWAMFFDKNYFFEVLTSGQASILFPIAFIAALLVLINNFWKTGLQPEPSKTTPLQDKDKETQSLLD